MRRSADHTPGGPVGAVEELQSRLLDERFYGPGLRFCLERMGTLQSRRILEIGCGRGDLTVLLAARGAQATGIDLRAGELDRGRLLAARLEVGERCRFVEADAHELPLDDGPFDMIVSKSTLQYMDRRFVLEAFVASLAADGMLVLNENLPGNPFIRVSRVLRAAGAHLGLRRDYARSIRGYLTFEDIRWLERRFATVHHREAHVLRVLVAPHRSTRPDGALGILDDAARRIDDLLLSRLPRAARFAWLTAIVAAGPVAPPKP